MMRNTKHLRWQHFWQKNGHTALIYLFVLALMLFVSFFSPDFFTVRNLKNLMLAAFPLLMVALGQTIVILTGGIDLSLGGTLALCNVVCVVLMQPDAPAGFLGAAFVSLLLGALCGLLNGLSVAKGRLPAIIVTIATTAIYDGLALIVLPKPGGTLHTPFRRFLTNGMNGLFPLVMAVFVLILVRALTNRTSYGKALRAIGGNEAAAYSTGINVARTKLVAYVLAGVLCAVAGIFLSARMNSGDPTIGRAFATNAVTATVVGGTAMSGAVGDPLGTIAGVFIITIINNMLNLFGVPSFYQYVAQGGILIMALALSALRKQ